MFKNLEIFELAWRIVKASSPRTIMAPFGSIAPGEWIGSRSQAVRSGGSDGSSVLERSALRRNSWDVPELLNLG
jgi:hypothetical protein